MELTSRQLQSMHWRLPTGFLLQQTHNSDSPAAPVSPPHSETHAFKPERSADLAAKRAARAKRPVPYDEEEARPAHSEAYRKIMSILQRLKRHPFAGPFLHPVDLALVPDYSDIIHEPIDLSTIESKLIAEQYTSAYEFSADVRKVWSNAFQYNAQGTELYQATVTMSAYFEGLFKGCENLLLTNRNDAIEGLYKQVEALKKEIRDIKGPKTVQKQVTVERPMTLQEKKALGHNIRALQPQYLRGLISIIKDSLPKDIQGTELEFDIDTLPPKVCRELERYVKSCLPATAPPPKSHAKKKPSNSGEVSKVQDVNKKLEELAVEVEGKGEMESESSSSSESEEGDMGVLEPMFGVSELHPLWPSDPIHRSNDHIDSFMMEFDQP